MCIRVWKQYGSLEYLSIYFSPVLSHSNHGFPWGVLVCAVLDRIMAESSIWNVELILALMHWKHCSAGWDQGSYFQLDKGAKAELVIRMVIFWFRKTNNKLRRFIPSMATTWRLVHELSPDCGGCSKNTQSCTVCQYNLTFKNISVINLYL